MTHVPVMVEQCLRFVLREDSRLVVDATVGAGGHARAILSQQRRVRLIGIDCDPDALAEARATLITFGDRVTLVAGNYADITAIVEPFGQVDGVLLDLGVSSMQIDRAERGFSYTREGPLDMRMGRSGRTAADMLATIDADDLGATLRRFGEVRGAKRLARAVVETARQGKLRTTVDLRHAVDAAVGGEASPALLSRVFQAIRIELNAELEHLERFLEGVLDVIAPGGRLVILSYHSLEDRMVKQFMRRESTDCICPPKTPVCVCGHRARVELLTRRAVKPTEDEIERNPRARSARLRAVERKREE